MAASPDWVNDGRSLVYMQASGEGTKDDVRLATLVQREVMDDKGKIKISENAPELAGLFFQKTTRVRCLTDGRILFNAMEIRCLSQEKFHRRTRKALCAGLGAAGNPCANYPRQRTG